MNELLQSAVSERQNMSPSPMLQRCPDELWVAGDREQLATVFTHLIQNAQEATSKTGRVAVRLLKDGDHACVEIEDDGIGMDEDFLHNRLFKPFDSTKGLTGMGIGAFESREFVRGLGGNIQVSSTPGVGSVFRIVLPCNENDKETMLAETEKEATGE
jgi:signal transduction histidine kinase